MKVDLVRENGDKLEREVTRNHSRLLPPYSLSRMTHKGTNDLSLPKTEMASIMPPLPVTLWKQWEGHLCGGNEILEEGSWKLDGEGWGGGERGWRGRAAGHCCVVVLKTSLRTATASVFQPHFKDTYLPIYPCRCLRCGTGSAESNVPCGE